MPSSVNLGKPEVVNWFKEQLNISRILDIGAGSGTYINLLKINNNICADAEWIAVEAWEPYIGEYNLKALYSNVVCQDIRLVDWDQLGSFDVVIAGDVLEHMKKDDAIALVDKILDHTKTLIVSIPICFCPQDDYGGNPFEIHVKDDWSDEEVTSTWGQYIKKKYTGSMPRKRDVPFHLGVYWLSK